MIELADVDQALEPRLQLHEGPEVSDSRDRSGDRRVGWEPLGGRRPGILDELLHPRPIFFFSRSSDRTFTSTVCPSLRSSEGCLSALPAHLADMQESVDASEIDERAVILDRLDASRERLADLKLSARASPPPLFARSEERPGG